MKTSFTYCMSLNYPPGFPSHQLIQAPQTPDPMMRPDDMALRSPEEKQTSKLNN